MRESRLRLHGVTLAGSVQPNEWPTTYHFEYGPTTSYGNSVPVPDASLKSETSAKEVQQTVTLPPSGPYHYRLVATNAGGSTFGEDRTVTVPPPGVSTAAAKRVAATNAALAGSVQPNGWPTTYHFEPGTTTSYGHREPVPDASLTSETSLETVERTVTLVPSHTYHYRLVATNAGGTTYGEDRTVTTLAAPAPGFVSSFGSLGTGNGQVNNPTGVALDASGNVWVTDTANNRVEEFSKTGKFVQMFGLGVKDGAAKEETCISTESCHAGIPGSGPGQLQEPTGIAVAGANLWVVDRANNRVEEFSAAGAYLNKQIVTSAPPYRTGPNGVALDAHGDLFVTGYWFGQIQKFSVETGKEEANVLTYINGYRSQEGVAVDQQGNVWVADWVQPRARVL